MTITPTPDFRTELQLLFDAIDSKSVYVLGYNLPLIEAKNRARAALATPPPEPPTDEEIKRFAEVFELFDEIVLIRAVLERWGQR